MNRLLIIGAHPDDAEYHAGGIASIYRKQGHMVKLISVTDGSAGHHRYNSEELRKIRKSEAASAGQVIGAEYAVWKFLDGWAEPSLEMRREIIREIRTFEPDLVLTHRTCDYHPDHRAVGQAVQDASYMMTVPLVMPEIPFLKKEPVVAYMVDQFSKPNLMQPDVVLTVSEEAETVAAMMMKHKSQFLDFLPFNLGIENVPEDEAAQKVWLKDWCLRISHQRCEHFTKHYPEDSRFEENRPIEVFEISEYARRPSVSELAELFPGGEPDRNYS